MSLLDYHRNQGAALAPDGIPLHYGDLEGEYQAALETAVLMDRSHEGRLEASGRDRFNLIQRISTNDVLGMALNEGRPTIFTNPNGRILDRIILQNRGEKSLLTTEPGRGAAILHYLQRQVFFNDEAVFSDLAPATQQFTLHGPQADRVIEALLPGALALPPLGGLEASVAGVGVYLMRRKPFSSANWAIIVPIEQVTTVWEGINARGASLGLRPAGSLTYNTLRIRAGQPGAGRELSQEYIPLEAGLWDEVSFSKGCYTGQEIIARMESRNRLAKTMVTLRLSAWVEAPAPLVHEGKPAGTLTSSVTTPDGEILGIGFVKLALAVPDQAMTIGEGETQAVIMTLAGAQPPQLANP